MNAPEVKLIDYKFMVGTHIDREINSSEYIMPHLDSFDGRINIHLSQVPMKYDRFPLNLRLDVEIKSPLVLDIHSPDQDLTLLAKEDYEDSDDEEDSLMRQYFS